MRSHYGQPFLLQCIGVLGFVEVKWINMPKKFKQDVKEIYLNFNSFMFVFLCKNFHCFGN